MFVYADEPLWDLDRGSGTFGPHGGYVRTENASLDVHQGLFRQEGAVDICHYRGSEQQRPEDTEFYVSDIPMHRGDSYVIETSGVNQSELFELRNRRTGTVRLENVTQHNQIPEVCESSGQGDSRDFRFVTDFVDPKLERNPQTGSLDLIFHVLGPAAKTIYEVVWVPCRVAACIGKGILQVLNMDSAPLHVPCSLPL